MDDLDDRPAPHAPWDGLFADAQRILSASEVVIYGAGVVGGQLVQLLRGRGIAVNRVLDRSPGSGRLCAGVPVTAPGILPVDPGIPVAIAVFNRAADIPGIAAALKASGHQVIVHFIDLHALLPELGNRFWLGPRAILDSESAAIARIGSLWADDSSLATFAAMLTLRRHGRYQSALVPIGGHQYLPACLRGWMPSEPVRLIDGGAYDGGTVHDLRAAGLALAAVAAFEPDPGNFALMTASLAAVAAAGTELFQWPCGLSDRSCQVRFSGGGGEGSHLDAQGSTMVQCISLDEALPGFAPTMVKFDIEGAEMDALAGARGIIARHRPALAISAYHEPDHLWRIPGWIADQDLGYRIALRAHGYSGFDAVVYAIPS